MRRVERRGVTLKEAIGYIGAVITAGTVIVGVVRVGITIGAQQQVITELTRRITELEHEAGYFHGNWADGHPAAVNRGDQ